MMIIIIIIGIFWFIVFRRKEIVSNEKLESINISNENETTYSEYGYYGPDSYTSWELGYEVAKKNGDWTRLPLSNEFKQKYNEKDGILGDLEFDEIELTPFDNDEKYSDKYYFVNRNNYFVISKGKEKVAYVYNLKYDGELLNDVLIKDVYNLTNEFGDEISVVGHKITKDTFKDSMDFLARGGNDELSVAVTDHFRRKYPFFLDIFEHYSPLRFNPIEFVPEKSSWDKQEAYFIVDSVLECKKRYYRVKFILDDKGYLDDVTVNCVNEEEYESSKDYRSNKLFYNNSNWQNLELTYNYKDKFKNSSYNLDIEKIDINYDVKEVLIEEKNYNEYLRLYTMKDGSTSVYYIKYILDDNAYVDDIECKKMPYDNISLKEAKELYLKDKNQ